MTTKLTYTGELVVETCWCGIRHAAPRELVNHMHQQWTDGDNQQGIFCPIGHLWVYSGEGKARRLERELEEAKAQLVATRDQLAAADREASRQAKRAAAGVCPCCQRSFVQLGRHMKSKHPDYADEAPR